MATALRVNDYEFTPYEEERVKEMNISSRKPSVELSLSDKIQLVEALNNPPEPNEQLKRAAMLHAKMFAAS